jgi:membrane fusion protein (multidrug efflux system)
MDWTVQSSWGTIPLPGSRAGPGAREPIKPAAGHSDYAPDRGRTVIKRLILVVLALGLVLGGIFGWKFYQMQQMAAQSGGPPPATVAAEPVAREQWRPSLSAVGTLVATQGVEVSSEIAGQVVAIRFESGHTVEEDQVLVQLDDRVDRAELQGLVAAQRLAEIQFERNAKLFKDRTVSRSEYDQARATLDSATAAVVSQRARIDKKRIEAPFAGQLGIRRVDLGQYLAPGDEIVSLQALDPIYLDYSLPERFLREVQVGQEVEVRVQAYPDQRFDGRIDAISPRIERTTRSVPIRATLANGEGRLRPGMFAEVRTLLPLRNDVLTLPQRAITYNPYGDSVFLVQEQDGQQVVERRQVQTGEVRQERVEILQGLQEGDLVVSAGHNKLRNGQSVVIDNSVLLSGEVTTP